MSDGVTLADFDEQRRIMLSMLRNITIAESNCPTGARVSVVAYSRYTKHLIRFQEHRSRKHLIEAIENLAKERTSEQPHLGAAMLYVGRNVFKHVRAGQLIRKVALFFTSGESQQPDEIVAAVMEYRALNIISAVISARNNLEISRALEIDDSGNSIFSLRREGDLEKVKNCAICYDPCIRPTECSFIQNTLPPKQVDVDLAIVVDSSRNMQADEYAGAKQLLSSVVEQLVVSPQPRRPGNQARIAVVQQSGTKEARVEFDLQTYQGQAGMKQHLMEKMQQQSGASILGQTLDYTLKEVLQKGAPPRRRRALLAVVASRTENRDRDWLRYISLKSKCEGVAMFVVAVGDRYNQTQVREMAGLPTRQHLVRISRLETQEQGYVQRFFRVFLSVLSKNLNPYPPASIKTECNQLTEPEDFFFGEDFASGQQELLADEAQTGQSIPRPQQEEIPNVLRGGSASGSQLRDVCFQHKKSGSCKNFTFMWFYNSKNAGCTRFLYSGCGGNQNRFKTREECEDTCLRKT
ncbi:collagen alpha-6(VI) chain-like [Cyprinodon tularosa]|uniref:collagen alpha-6(VI) chain-like n=1 Tax=Cyprinodon tularosa TaxID=77115 RepID=UPI0018E2917F|nr:collagen alpha-6(VI) chain-like [Cyprinodon tularosa]